jgi:hypothetical protein
VFVIAVVLIFFVAMKPLFDDKFVDSVASKAALQPLRTDAQFIALSLLEHSATPGTNSAHEATFGDAAATVIQENEYRRTHTDFSNANAIGPGAIPADPTRFAFGNFEDYVADSSYAATLDTVFAPDGAFWESYGTAKTANVIAGVGVVLYENGKRLDDTCREYAHAGDYGSPVCELSKQEKWTASESADVGYVHLPANEGTGTLYVYVHWRGR